MTTHTTPDHSARWGFLTNHAHVLLQVARSPEATVRELAERVGITERATHRILADLVEAGYVMRTRVGRRNRYRIDQRRRLRHPELDATSIGALLAALGAEDANLRRPRR